MRRPLVLNGRSEEPKQNLEIPAETEFSDLLHPTAGKKRLLSLLYRNRRRASFLYEGGRGNNVVAVNE
jgi:hypothetical protein